MKVRKCVRDFEFMNSTYFVQSIIRDLYISTCTSTFTSTCVDF